MERLWISFMDHSHLGSLSSLEDLGEEGDLERV